MSDAIRDFVNAIADRLDRIQADEYKMRLGQAYSDQAEEIRAEGNDLQGAFAANVAAAAIRQAEFTADDFDQIMAMSRPAVVMTVDTAAIVRAYLDGIAERNGIADAKVVDDEEWICPDCADAGLDHQSMFTTNSRQG